MEKSYKAPMGEGIYEVNTGDWRIQFPEMDKTRCTECGICLMYCPVNSVKAGYGEVLLKNGNTRQGLVYTIDLSYCKGCGVCAQECPQDAITMKRENKR